MNRYLICPGLIAIILIVFSSCTFENEEDYFDQICDTADLTYADVESIFQNNCSTCHNSEFTYVDEIKLDNYENIVSSIRTGRLIPAINHEGPVDMPFGQPKLDDCTIQKVEAWQENGLPED